MSKNSKMSVDELKTLRNHINDQITDVEIDPFLKKEDALMTAQEKGATNLTKNKLTYLVEQGLVKPKIIEGDRDTHLYGREHISTIILIQKLKKEKGLTYSQISSLLLEEQNAGISNKKAISADVGLPPQGMRAQYILYSRVIAVLLNHLLGDAIKPGLIIFLRERHATSNANLPKGSAKISHEWMDLKEADDYVGLIRPKDDLVAFVSPESEILFGQLDKTTLVEYKKMHWLLVTIRIGFPTSQYDLLVGMDDRGLMQDIHVSPDSFGANVIGTLLKILFANPAQPKLSEDVVPANEFDKSTILYSLVNFIPEISELWEYCAVLTSSPEKPNHLKIAAISHDFPRDMRQEIQNILIEPGQPLTGWAYQTNYPMVIQRSSGVLDPRLAYQNKENATAAIAIPTRARDRFNGVFYVGTRYPIPEDVQAFTEAEIRILYIIADIVGEVIERNRITKFFELNATQIIGTPQLHFQDWSALRGRLTSTLENIKKSTVSPRDNDNLHLTIIRIESHSDIYRKDPNISKWLTTHVLETTRTFFNRNEMGNPEIFLHNDSLSIAQTKEFVCLIPTLNIADERDREIRKNLRYLLSSIKLSFPIGETLLIDTNVWSMPFRHKNLLIRIDDKNLGKRINFVVDELISEIEDALVIIPNIEKAHQNENDRAYSAALEQYIEASFLAPNNRYIQRHIAKAYAAIGDLKNSAKYWEKILAQEEYSSHYLRYAHILARMGNSKKANEYFQKAHSLDKQNSKILVEWGDFLLVEGKTEDAIKQYETALKLEMSDKNQIWLRLAEVSFESGDLDRALSFIKLVLDRLPDHQDARRLMLKVLKKIKR
jgi:tetratricopeptide (TPR) repeat protein/DNA-binding transcriptional MerR regulator